MPGDLTELTEISTALGMLAHDLDEALAKRPSELCNVPELAWQRLVSARQAGQYADSFATAFANGKAFLEATEGLRHRPPLIAEWKGPHRPPGDDVIPADLRIDHVYLVSCKYLSQVLLNPGPPRLFERLLVGDERSTVNWFAVAAPEQFQAFYEAAVSGMALADMPPAVGDLSRPQQRVLKEALRPRLLPNALSPAWSELCEAVAAESARRWTAALATARVQLQLLWRLLRISTASYFVLGTDKRASLRLRVDSKWDWMQAFELRSFDVAPRYAGQPEVGWQALVRRRVDGRLLAIEGHVEIRWSHGRFFGSPEAKVYLDTPHGAVPGYHPLE
ncbi:MAG: hypothetical protein JWL70_2817 [Acidimicrobiia bacterium]|nr:hypothetical protein [Acidimicrobiia bacterium]